MSCGVYFANKMLRASFDGIYVNRAGVGKVLDMIANKENVVLIPEYKSFMDTVLIHYSLLDAGIKLPFTIGSQEDTPNSNAAA